MEDLGFSLSNIVLVYKGLVQSHPKVDRFGRVLLPLSIQVDLVLVVVYPVSKVEGVDLNLIRVGSRIVDSIEWNKTAQGNSE